MKREEVLNFYKGTDYNKEIRSGNPSRPKEWHIPIYLYKVIKSQPDILEDFRSEINNGKIEIQLTQENCLDLRATLLHESIFSFYKAFYNYLATKRLYKGGVEHWIYITNYYSKLYLARAITTLLGCQSYSVSANKPYFYKELLEIINPKNYNKFLTGNTRVGYSVELKIDVEKNNGILTLSSKGISTHQDIWSIYKLLQIEELGITRLDNSDTENWDMIDERNKENYSFDGYMQLDFNLSSSSFPGYFNRDFVANKSVFIYDEIVGEVLNGFQELYHLYNEFEITNLPIELEKFEHMINYMLDDSIEKEKLLKLCKSGFPLENEFNFEINNYYNE